jgi:hypothetical protein
MVSPSSRCKISFANIVPHSLTARRLFAAITFQGCACSELDRFGAVVYDLSLDLGHLDEFSAKVSHINQGQGKVCRGQMYNLAQHTHQLARSTGIQYDF